MTALEPEHDRLRSESSWSDPRTGTTEEVAFLGPSGQRILAFLHRPTTGATRGGVVVCSSLYEDLSINYRAELSLARALARRGFAVVRFHYRGAGNSDDLGRQGMTLETMVADARVAARWLTERTGTTRPMLCGSRVGALVATELASRDGGEILVLWAPVVSGEAFFRGMSRANRVAGVRAGARRPSAEASTERRPTQGGDGDVEMLGNVVRRGSLDDLRTRELPPAIGPGRRVLLVQLSLGEADDPQYRDLVSRWTADGAEVEVLRVRTRQLWMIPDQWEPEEARSTTRDLVEGIAGWVETTAPDQS